MTVMLCTRGSNRRPESSVKVKVCREFGKCPAERRLDGHGPRTRTATCSTYVEAPRDGTTAVGARMSHMEMAQGTYSVTVRPSGTGRADGDGLW